MSGMSDIARPAAYAITLVLHTDGKPGWRVHITKGAPEGVPVSPPEAERIAALITEVSGTEGDQVTPFSVVRDGTSVLRQGLEDALTAAESQAATIPSLRKALGELE